MEDMGRPLKGWSEIVLIGRPCKLQEGGDYDDVICKKVIYLVI